MSDEDHPMDVNLKPDPERIAGLRTMALTLRKLADNLDVQIDTLADLLNEVLEDLE